MLLTRLAPGIRSGLRFSRPYGQIPFQTITMPALSPTGETGAVLKWLKKEGDYVQQHDCLAEIETDKAVISFEIPDQGYVAKLLIEEGKNPIKIGEPIAILVNEARHIPEFKDYGVPTIEPTNSSYPQPSAVITMPALSPTMETGKVLKWLKEEGDKLDEGDLLAEIETDKAIITCESMEKGYLAKILVNNNDPIEVGKPIALVVSKESDVTKFAEYTTDMIQE